MYGVHTVAHQLPCASGTYPRAGGWYAYSPGTCSTEAPGRVGVRVSLAEDRTEQGGDDVEDGHHHVGQVALAQHLVRGMGLAWLISAIYWDPTVGVGATDEWKARYPDIFERQVAAGETPGGFVVYAGDLGFSVPI